MASLIAKQPKDTKKQTTVSLSGTVLADLELYCRFIDSARDWVINEALKSVFRRDRAFLEWKERAGLEGQPKPSETLPLTLASVPPTAPWEWESGAWPLPSARDTGALSGCLGGFDVARHCSQSHDAQFRPGVFRGICPAETMAFPIGQ